MRPLTAASPHIVALRLFGTPAIVLVLLIGVAFIVKPDLMMAMLDMVTPDGH